MSVTRKITGWVKPTITNGNMIFDDWVKDSVQLSVEEGTVEELQIEGGEAEDADVETDRYILEGDRRVDDASEVDLGHTFDAGDVEVDPYKIGALGFTLVDTSLKVTMRGAVKGGLILHYKWKTKGAHDADGNPTDIVPFKKAAGSYTAVDSSMTGYSSKNPKTEGWYIKNGSVYIPARDTEPQEGMTYYSRG